MMRLPCFSRGNNLFLFFILYLFGQYVLEEMDVERIYLERLRSGSYRDFTKLYESYASRLYAFALHLTHSDALAKDIVQETFIKVWVRREQIDLDMSFRCFPIYDGQEPIIE